MLCWAHVPSLHEGSRVIETVHGHSQTWGSGVPGEWAIPWGSSINHHEALHSPIPTSIQGEIVKNTLSSNNSHQLTFYLIYILTLHLTFDLADILALSDILCGMCSGPCVLSCIPMLAIGFGSMRAQAELDFAMSCWPLLLALAPLVPTATTSRQRRRRRRRAACWNLETLTWQGKKWKYIVQTVLNLKHSIGARGAQNHNSPEVWLNISLRKAQIQFGMVKIWLDMFKCVRLMSKAKDKSKQDRLATDFGRSCLWISSFWGCVSRVMFFPRSSCAWFYRLSLV